MVVVLAIVVDKGSAGVIFQMIVMSFPFAACRSAAATVSNDNLRR